jgi:hypothetical protein
MKQLLLIIGLCLASLTCHAFGPFWYRAQPIEMWIVDEDTNTPIEGVIAVAHWQLDMGTLGGYSPVGQLTIMETVSDAKGRVYFPGWGPKFAAVGVMQPRRPSVLLFKTGYRYVELDNFDDPDTEETTTLRKFYWSGKTVKLKPFRGTDEEYAKHVYDLDSSLEFVRYGLLGTLEDCEWKKTPRMLVALHRISESFDLKQVKLPGWRGGARIRKVTDVGNQNKCGPAADFFRSYLP